MCGAGTAGLAAAATLRGVGVDTVVLEQADQVGSSWRSRYDGLRLNTAGWMSTQPGFRASRRRYGEYPTRDKWIEYLEDYAAHHQVDVRFGTTVQKVAPVEGGWRVTSDHGSTRGALSSSPLGSTTTPTSPIGQGAMALPAT